MDGGGRGGEGKNFHSPILPLSLFLTVDRPLDPNYFSPQPSAAIKIKDGGHDFRQENTEHSLVKITPALQAIS